MNTFPSLRCYFTFDPILNSFVIVKKREFVVPNGSLSNQDGDGDKTLQICILNNEKQYFCGALLVQFSF